MKVEADQMGGQSAAKLEISAFQEIGDNNPFNDGFDGGQGLFDDGDDLVMDIGGDNNLDIGGDNNF